MALSNPHRVREQVSGFGGGTGAVTLPVSAVSGFQTFLSGYGASGGGYVCLVMGTQWEVCAFTLNAGGTTLTRGTVLASSTGSAINFSAGTLDCFGVLNSGVLGDGTVGAPAFSFLNDPDSGFYRIGANNLGLALNGAKVVDYSTAGESITGTLTVSGLITATAGQIAFPATQNPSAGANTLDDYEEGTFTPAVTFATPGNLSVSYASTTGRYTKIGRMVYFTILLNTSAFTHTTASSFFEITGLPFASSQNFVGAGTIMMRGWTKASYTYTALETSNSTFLYVLAGGSGQAQAELTTADVPTGGTIAIYCTGQYES